jgi:hypothetical protein
MPAKLKAAHARFGPEDHIVAAPIMYGGHVTRSATPEPTRIRRTLSRNATPLISVGVAFATLGIALASTLDVWETVFLTIANGGVAGLVTRLVSTSRAPRAFARALETGDLVHARALFEEMRRAPSRQPAAIFAMAINESALLCAENRHAEVIPLLEPLISTREPLTSTSMQQSSRVWVLNNLAVAMSHTGEARAAVALAQRAVTISGLYPYLPIQRASLLGTLGTAQILAGDADEGVETLAVAIALGGSDRDLAVREFYRGEGLRALGRVHDAREAYERASRSASEDIATRARTRANAVDVPFR